MTRFARAKGSKASNERRPEESTSWKEMKEQIIEAQKMKNKNSETSVPPIKKNHVNISTEWAAFECFQETNTSKRKKLETPLGSEVNDCHEKKRIKQQDHSQHINSERIPGKHSSKKIKTYKQSDQLEFTDISYNNQNSAKIPKKKKRREQHYTSAINEDLHIEEFKNNNEKNASDQYFEKRNVKNNSSDFGSSKARDKRNQNIQNKFNINSNLHYDKGGRKREQREEIHGKFNINSNLHHDKGGRKREQQEEIHGNMIFKRRKEENYLNESGEKKKLTRFEKEQAGLPFARKKPGHTTAIYIEGREVEIRCFDGFPVKKDDWERLTQLKMKMLAEGISKDEVAAAMKLERRRCEKALAHERKKVCFHCRKAGHMLSECPAIAECQDLAPEAVTTGVCFKCGSTEHSQIHCRVIRGDEFRFAKCFVCGEQGHISRQCPDNPRGLYPRGGSCKICGDVTHLKKDCPQEVEIKQESTVTLDTLHDGGALEALDAQKRKYPTKSSSVQRRKHIRFE